MTRLLIRDVRVEGVGAVDVRLQGGAIEEIGPDLAPRDEAELEGRGGALIPGLIDHHIHLFGLAATASSVRLDPDTVGHAGALQRTMQKASAALPPGEWLRGVGYDETSAGLLDRHSLDAILADRPVRIQSRTGGLWTLNSAALDRLGDTAPMERDETGALTGRLWRNDHWLRERLAATPPSLQPVGALLARYGVTGVTDASVTNDDAQADHFDAAGLPQTLMLMSGGALRPRPTLTVGAVKLLLDDHDLPDFELTMQTAARARLWSRNLAVHCVTAGELAFTLALFDACGVRDGDRLEHCGIADADAIAHIARLGLIVVTQPAFIRERGDRYLTEVDAADRNHLYPCASLLRAGIRVAASSDAPYAAPDPWAAIATATRRATRTGKVIGRSEGVDARRALGLYLGRSGDPGGPERRVAVGEPADLCLLATPLAEALGDPNRVIVTATIVDGRVIHQATA